MEKYQRYLRLMVVAATLAFLVQHASHDSLVGSVAAQDRQGLTPIQLEIEKQRQRLSSAEVEDRREALVRLRSLKHAQASRVALSGLTDPAPVVRATAAAAVLSLPPEESTAGLIPLLNDKDEFVRQQTAYALGETHSRSAVDPLIERLSDKKDSVRGAAAVALGQIADASALTSLAAVLHAPGGTPQSKKSKKSKPEQNAFVLRAAARSLGQIGNSVALPALMNVLQDQKTEDDVRREAAFALGAIGDSSALPALREALTARDPYLAEAAREAVRKIQKGKAGS